MNQIGHVKNQPKLPHPPNLLTKSFDHHGQPASTFRL